MSDKETAAPPLIEPMSGALAAFSAALAKRYPERFIKRFVFPKNISQAREIFMMEIDGKDEIAAAAMADATMSDKERASRELSSQAEKRESIRIAIVGIGERRGDAVAYRAVNDDGIPFMEINNWPSKAWGCLYAYNGQMNGVPMDELREGIEGAQTVGAFAPPTTNATPESSSLGK